MYKTMAKAMPVPLCPLPKLQSTCLKHYTFFHFQHFQTPALFQQSDLSLMKKRLQFLVWFYSGRIYPPSSVQLQYFRENLFMIQPTWLNVHFQAITFLFSELLSNTVWKHKGWKEQRTIGFTLHSGRKGYTQPQYLNFSFLPSNRQKANTTS